MNVRGAHLVSLRWEANRVAVGRDLTDEEIAAHAGDGRSLLRGLLMATSATMAQVEPNTHEVHVYTGWLFGDDLTDQAISGKTPKLDDDFVGGFRYAYNFTSAWGAEMSPGYTPNQAT